MADAAIASGRLGSVAEWRDRLCGTLADRLVAEGERRLLWLPVFFGAGIGVYFLLKVEPPLWPGIAAAIAGLGLVIAVRRYRGCREAALAFTVFAAGFALMRETAWEHEAPMLQRHLGPLAVTGRVVDIDLVEKGWRIVIDADPLPGVDASDRPRRLRVHIPPSSDELNPGDRVSLKAKLYPVPAQILPGGRDFQRELYFAGIGAVGYAFGGAHRVAGPESEAGWRESLRQLPIVEAPFIIGTPARQILSLRATALPRSFPAAAPATSVLTYQAPCRFSSGAGRRPGRRG